jgi:hypothetical protein
MRSTTLAVPILVFAAAAGCGGAGDSVPADAGASCPSAPSACSKPAPSYSKVIVPILEQSCIPCHGPKGIAGHSEATYAEVYAQEEPILSVVAGCTMPPSTYPPLSAEQREALLDWLICGTPDD